MPRAWVGMLSGWFCTAGTHVLFFSSRRRHTSCSRDWSSDVCSSDLGATPARPSPSAPSSLRFVVVQSTYATKNRREDGAEGEGLAGVAPDFTAYLDAMIAERKASAQPPDDFVTRLIGTSVDGEQLTDLEMRTQLAFLLISGNETTRHLIANMLETVCSDAALL